MSVSEMTKQGPHEQWVIFGPDCGFAYRSDFDRKVDFDCTETGWDLTVEIEPPNEAGKQLQEKSLVLNQLSSSQKASCQLPDSVPDQIRQMICQPCVDPFGQQGASL